VTPAAGILAATVARFVAHAPEREAQRNRVGRFALAPSTEVDNGSDPAQRRRAA